jgi:hypothetical protein
MKFLKERTEWTTQTPNHTYLVVDSKEKMLGYIRSGTKNLKCLDNPCHLMFVAASLQKFPIRSAMSNPNW